MHQPTLSGTISTVLRRHLWLRPLIALAVLASVGWVMRAKVEATLKANLRSVLQTTLLTEQTALRNWMLMQRNQAESAAADHQIATMIRSLIKDAGPQATSLELLQLPQSSELRRELAPVLETHEFSGFVVVDLSGRVVTSYRNELVG